MLVFLRGPKGIKGITWAQFLTRASSKRPCVCITKVQTFMIGLCWVQGIALLPSAGSNVVLAVTLGAQLQEQKQIQEQEAVAVGPLRFFKWFSFGPTFAFADLCAS
jgi:hypothetical protein